VHPQLKARPRRALAAALVLLLASCGDAKPDQRQVIKQSIAPKAKLLIVPYQATADIQIDFGSYRGSGVLAGTGDELLALGRRLNDGSEEIPPGVEELSILVVASPPKARGIGGDIVAFSVLVSKLRDAAFTLTSGSTLLDQVRLTTVWLPYNQDIFTPYCAEHASSAFCTQISTMPKY
jgi:hypothetical protein